MKLSKYIIITFLSNVSLIFFILEFLNFLNLKVRPESISFVGVIIILITVILIPFIFFLKIKNRKKILCIALLGLLILVFDLRIFNILINKKRYFSIVKHQTNFSYGYSYNNFQSINVGMTINDVTDCLGNPLRKMEKNGFEILTYSDINGKSYFQKWIIFKNGKVVEILSDYLTKDSNPFSKSKYLEGAKRRSFHK